MNEQEIMDALAAASETYEAAVKTTPVAQAELAGKEVIRLRKELSALLATDAKACPSCGEQPFGMRRYKGVDGTPDTKALILTFYQIACMGCGSAGVSGLGQTTAEAAADFNQAATAWKQA